jgi:hypothetical protein
MVRKFSSVSGMMNNIKITVFWDVVMCSLVDTNILEECAASSFRREVCAKPQETVHNMWYDWE